MKKRTWIWISGVSLLLATVAIVFSVVASLPIQNQTESCFKRYQTGESFKKYSVSMNVEKDDQTREGITLNEFECAASRLGFSDSQINRVRFGTDGKVDLEKYQLRWRTAYATECTESLLLKCTSREIVKTSLVIKIVDYR